MNICFYNTNHIGDVYFSSFFINLICKQNPSIRFYYYVIQGDVFLENIENIERITPNENQYNNTLTNGSPPEHLLNRDVLNILLQNRMESCCGKILQYNNTNYLFINTWCKAQYLNHIDYDFITAIPAYNNYINVINNIFGIKLNLEANKNNIIDTNLITYKKMNPTSTDIPDLENTIFIFNFKPRSCPYDINRLNNFIQKASETTKIILSTYDSMFDKNNNITFIDRDYHIHPTPLCYNLLSIWDIAIKCKIICIIPTGSSWTFLHLLNKIKKSQIYIVNDNHYHTQLNNNINFLIDKPENIINCAWV